MKAVKVNHIKKNNKYGIVVIGTSAGGLQALLKLVNQLSPSFPLPVLVVQHVSADATGSILLNELSALKKLKCFHAVNNTILKAGHLYLAPSDHHLMVTADKKILITKGAHENRSRPAIDPLFRSAAVAFRNQVIAILLTGYLDDGSSGLNAVKRCGGVCIVQHPDDAQYPDMPRNSLNQVKPDFLIPISEMGGVPAKLVTKPLGKSPSLPKDILIESEIAQRVLSDLPSVNALGEQVPFNCPGCGGVLWKIDKDKTLRYRCHTGHAYTASTLLAEQTKKIDETLWTALRMFEERKNLLMTLASKQPVTGSKSSASERVKISDVHIQRIRLMLRTNNKGTDEDIPA